MRVAISSDFHGILPEVKESDILCICGDVIPLSIQWNDQASKEWFNTTFANWVRSLPVKDVVLIGGNHDAFLYWHRKEDLRSIFKEIGVTYLKDETALVQGLSIHGTPWCHKFGNWAFMRDDVELSQKFESIPYNLDILLTHDAPYGYHDEIIENVVYKNGGSIGNIPLAKAIEEKQPKYHFSGHLHGTDHKEFNIGHTKTYSVSLVDEDYNIAYPILYIDL